MTTNEVDEPNANLSKSSARVRSTELCTTEEGIRSYLRNLAPVSVGDERDAVANALIPWLSDVLISEQSVRTYGRDLSQFVRHMDQNGIGLLDVSADHVRVYKGAMIKAGYRPATIARKLSVIRGAYRELSEKGLISRAESQAISAVKSPPVQRNTTPALTHRQAIELLGVIPKDTPTGVRDLALLQTFFITACRVSAVTRACVGHLETDGVEHYLHVREKRNKEARKILLHAARAIFRYLQLADIATDVEGPLFRPLSPDGREFLRRHLDRKTPWRLVKKYCRLAGIGANRLSGRGIGVHSLRKTAITDAIRNGAGMHEVREFAGHADIRTTELYYVRRDEDAEIAARRIQIVA